MDNIIVGAVIFNSVVCVWIVYVMVEDIIGEIRFRRVLDVKEKEVKAKSNKRAETKTARRAGAKKEIEKAFKKDTKSKNRTRTNKGSR